VPTLASASVTPWNGVVQLAGWGIDVGRRGGQAWPAASLTGPVNGIFGVVIIVLEVLPR
jgi:hypothetical protein